MLGCSHRLALAKPGQTAGLAAGNAAGNAILVDGCGLSTREAERCMRSRDWAPARQYAECNPMRLRRSTRQRCASMALATGARVRASRGLAAGNLKTCYRYSASLTATPLALLRKWVQYDAVDQLCVRIALSSEGCTGASLSFVDELRMSLESTLWFSTVMCCKISYKAEAIECPQAKQAMKRQGKQIQGRADTLTHNKKNACGATSSYKSKS